MIFSSLVLSNPGKGAAHSVELDFQSFLRGETQIPKDEAFKECIETYLHIFLR